MCSEAYQNHVYGRCNLHDHFFSNHTFDMFSKLKASTKLLRNRRLYKAQSSTSIELSNLDLKATNESSIIDQQRTDANEEDVTIVWLTKDAKNIEEPTLIESLRYINDYIRVRALNKLFFS